MGNSCPFGSIWKLPLHPFLSLQKSVGQAYSLRELLDKMDNQGNCPLADYTL
jgi:hypothetical protein